MKLDMFSIICNLHYFNLTSNIYFNGFALRRIPYNDMRVELNLGNGRGNPSIPGLECKIKWKMVAIVYRSFMVIKQVLEMFQYYYFNYC
jgi:hypothetical protein